MESIIGTDTDRSATFYSLSTSTMGLSRTVSVINGDFSRILQNFPPSVFNATDEGVSVWSWVTPDGLKEPQWLPDRERRYFSRLATKHERDRQMDGHWPTASTTPRLRIASRGKNH